MEYIITDKDGNEVAVITQNGNTFSIELDTENYDIKTKEIA